MKNQIKQLESGNSAFWKQYIQGASQTKQYHCFLRGTPKISRIKKLESGHYTFWNCYIQGASRNKPYHCFFCGASRISRKLDFDLTIFLP